MYYSVSIASFLIDVPSFYCVHGRESPHLRSSLCIHEDAERLHKYRPQSFLSWIDVGSQFPLSTSTLGADGEP